MNSRNFCDKYAEHQDNSSFR